jgi:pimeloyl-ACP methyl ester carboxylesterase
MQHDDPKGGVMADSATPVVFIHGLWLSASSWQPWVDLFRENGYAPVAPEWPGTPESPEEARAHPEQIPASGIREVTDHFAKVIEGLPSKPIIIGHSFGGLVTQVLLARELGVAGVAIDPAPIKGVINLPPSALRVASVALRNPANRNRAVALTANEFRYGFGNELSGRESEELYQKWTIPSPGRPLFEAAFANFARNSPAKVDTRNNTRGPLLVTAGQKDHTVPPAVSHATVKLYRHSSATTDFQQFAGRGHSLTVDSGWREVADAVLGWLKRQNL